MGLLCRGLYGDRRAQSPQLSRFLCPLWWSWCFRLTVLANLFLLCPFLNVYHPYRPSILLIRPFKFALMTLCFTCRVRKLANGCCIFVFKPFWRADLKDLHIFFRLTIKGKKKGIKYNDFLPPKLAWKILPGSAFYAILQPPASFYSWAMFQPQKMQYSPQTIEVQMAWP